MVAHLLGVQLEELDAALAEFVEALGVGLRLGRSSCCAGFGGDGRFGQTCGDLDLRRGDGDAHDCTPERGGEMAGCAADAAANIEDAGAFFELGDLEEEGDEVHLGLLFGLCGFGLVGWPVTVVDVFSP